MRRKGNSEREGRRVTGREGEWNRGRLRGFTSKSQYTPKKGSMMSHHVHERKCTGAYL